MKENISHITLSSLDYCDSGRLDKLLLKIYGEQKNALEMSRAFFAFDSKKNFFVTFLNFLMPELMLGRWVRPIKDFAR